MQPTYHESWNSLFDSYDFSYMDSLYNQSNGTEIYPEKENVFRVFEMDVKDIRVLLLGQDPYHGPGQAHGLSFSVPTGISIPPSLRNIYKELQAEFPERGYTFQTGNLERWFNEEKIFLLNSSLSVERGTPGSHMDVWEDFTNDVIRFISENNSNCVFLLLGNFAKAKAAFIKNPKVGSKLRIITGVHPSPMAAQHGFFGSGIFKKVELALEQPINWSV